MDGDDVVRTTRKPPTMRQLLEDPIYRKMMVTPVALPGELPYAVYALKTNGKWGGKLFPSYVTAFEALKLVLAPMNREHYRDAALTSRARFFAPPVKFMWETYAFEWCARCRRPSTFRKDQGLHALLKAPILTTDEAYRCFYCGIRKVAMPNYQPIMYTPEELAAMAKAEEGGANNDQSPRRGRSARNTTAKK